MLDPAFIDLEGSANTGVEAKNARNMKIVLTTSLRK
jgi:hypothetical protein